MEGVVGSIPIASTNFLNQSSLRDEKGKLEGPNLQKFKYKCWGTIRPHNLKPFIP
jgi:hypothetical protein